MRNKKVTGIEPRMQHEQLLYAIEKNGLHLVETIMASIEMSGMPFDVAIVCMIDERFAWDFVDGHVVFRLRNVV
jgi:hypothetical protein